MNPNLLCSTNVIKEAYVDGILYRQIEEHKITLGEVKALEAPCTISEIKPTKNQKAAVRRKRRLEKAKEDPNNNYSLITLIKKARRELTKLSALKKKEEEAYKKSGDFSLPEEIRRHWLQEYLHLAKVRTKKDKYCLKLRKLANPNNENKK